MSSAVNDDNDTVKSTINSAVDIHTDNAANTPTDNAVETSQTSTNGMKYFRF